MANQVDIAKALGITQATVSRALRGDRSISPEMREKVHETAERLGYNPKNYLSLLMSSVRAGKKLSEKGTIALLVEAASQKERDMVQAYRVFHQGAMKRSEELGFRVENFFLQAPGMTADKLDRILQARGINGIILPPPYLSNRKLKLTWERYAAVGVGFGWEEQDLDRVVYDDFRNYVTAFRNLQRLGYMRIGTVLSNQFVQGHRGGNQWYPAYLDCQSTIAKTARIPVFSGSTPMPGEAFTAEMEHKLPGEFREWFLKWKPDALITLVGHEKQWLDAMNLKVPRDVGLVCLAQTAGAAFAGIDEKGELIAEAAVELVAAKIARNEFGLSDHPKVMMVQGAWVDGPTVKSR
jgi:LacI family transcriptional regulator